MIETVYIYGRSRIRVEMFIIKIKINPFLAKLSYLNNHLLQVVFLVNWWINVWMHW